MPVVSNRQNLPWQLGASWAGTSSAGDGDNRRLGAGRGSSAVAGVGSGDSDGRSGRASAATGVTGSSGWLRTIGSRTGTASGRARLGGCWLGAASGGRVAAALAILWAERVLGLVQGLEQRGNESLGNALSGFRNLGDDSLDQGLRGRVDGASLDESGFAETSSSNGFFLSLEVGQKRLALGLEVLGWGLKGKSLSKGQHGERLDLGVAVLEALNELVRSVQEWSRVAGKVFDGTVQVNEIVTNSAQNIRDGLHITLNQGTSSNAGSQSAQGEELHIEVFRWFIEGGCRITGTRLIVLDLDTKAGEQCFILYSKD